MIKYTKKSVNVHNLLTRSKITDCTTIADKINKTPAKIPLSLTLMLSWDAQQTSLLLK